MHGRNMAYGLLLLAVGADIGRAQDPNVVPYRDIASVVPQLRRTISLELAGTPIDTALQVVARKAALPITYSDAILPSKKVWLSADNIRTDKALESILRDSGLRLLALRSGQVVVVRDRSSNEAPLDVARRGVIVGGRVTSKTTGAPIAGASIVLTSAEGTRRLVSTDSGKYQFADVPPGSHSVTARYIGYRPLTRKIVVDTAPVVADLALESQAVTLNELVTTATGRQRRRDLGNAVTTIHADSVLRNAPVRNLTDLLQSRVPGLTVQHTSGAPGDPARLRLRGLGSIQRSNDPVVVVDGIRVYAAQSGVRSGNLANPSAPAPSPLDLIDPNIVETVEVFKGPSAATLYGADAANGVIVISTKKGRPGPTRWHASAERGMTHTLGRYPVGYYRWGHSLTDPNALVCPIDVYNCVSDSLTQFQALNDPRFTPFGQGHRTGLSLTAEGGTQALTYSLTGTYGDETGLLKLPDYEVDQFRTAFNREAPAWMQRPHQLKNWSVTSRIGARLSATADVALTASLARTQQERTDLENQVASLAATYIDSINHRYYQARGGVVSLLNGIGGNGLTLNPYILNDYYGHTMASSLVFTTGLSGTWRPRSWLDFSGQAGLNAIPRSDQRFVPPGLVALTDSGSINRGTGQSLVSTFTLQGNLRRPLGRGFVFLTNAGVDLTTQSTVDLSAGSTGLVPGTSTIGGIGKTVASDAYASGSVFGWHIEPRLQGQRFSVSTGLRLDGGSAYGTRLTGLGGGGGGGFLKGLLALPKLNGSWVISEEPFFPFKSVFSSLRLRGAYGQAQVQPGPADRLRLYHYLVTGTPSSVELQTLGNTQLRPERSTEFEGGFDADLFDSRVSVELTGYRKTQVDALMPVTLPPSVNGGATVLTNIGTIRNTGVELTLHIAPVQSSLLGWSSELSYSRNHNELVKLGDGVVPNPATGFMAGYPVGGRWAKPILGYADQNSDDVLQANEILIGDSAVFVGRLYPAYQLALHSTVTLLRGVVNVTGGLTYDAGMTQVDELAGKNWVLTRALSDPTTPLNQQAAVLSYVEENGAPRTTYGLTRDISTFRFNELSVGYQAPTRVARFLRAQRLSLAVQGRNLVVHSTYQGRDPDVNAWGPGEDIVDGGQLAQPRTWQLRVDLDY